MAAIVIKPKPPAPPEAPPVPTTDAAAANAPANAEVLPIDPDREPVLSDGAEFEVLHFGVREFRRGDRIKRSDLPPAADIRRLIRLDAIAPLPGVDVDAILNPPAPAPAPDTAPADKPTKGK